MIALKPMSNPMVIVPLAVGVDPLAVPVPTGWFNEDHEDHTSRLYLEFRHSLSFH
jgi:hypothetical protein